MTLEIEMKFPLTVGTAELEAKLAALGARVGETERHADRYFRHPVRDFAQTDEALRLRTVNERNVITYKGPKIDPVTKTRQEIEIEYAAGDDANGQFAEILARLGFTESLTVRKTRRVFHVEWQGWKVEVLLDDVEGLGQFAEIETLAEADEMEAAKKCILTLATELGLEQSERRGYLRMLLERV